MSKNLKLVVILVLIMTLGVCGSALSRSREGRYVREEAARRNMTLITISQAKEIAARQIGTSNLRFKEVELEDESDDYPNGTNFRPVYKIECLSGHDEYEIEIDAVTGKILKFELDD